MAGGGSGMKRLLGLGFLFGAKDDGATDTAEGVADGFDRMSESVTSVGKSTGGLLKFNNAITALNAIQLSRVSGALEDLADKAGVGPGAQANQLESFGVQFGQTFKNITAGMGDYRKEIDKYRGAISGVAFNLEVDAGELTKAVKEVVRTGDNLEDYGLTVRGLAGITQQGILGADELTKSMTALAKGYGLGAKGAQRVFDRQVALGEQMGLGQETLKAMPSIMQAADAAVSDFADINVEQLTESLTRLGLAQQKYLGGNFDDNMQSAVSMFQELMGAQREMRQLVTGLGSGFPQLAQELGIASGDIDKSMSMVMSDPLAFAQSLQKLYATLPAGDTRLERLNASLEQMPANFKFLVKGGADAAKAMEAATKPVQNFEGALNRMGKSGSGAARTFAESMDLLEARHEEALRKMTSSTDREVLKRQRKMYDDFAKKLDKWRKHKFAGPLVQAFLNVRRHGLVHGLIPVLDDLASKSGPLGNVAKKVREFLPLLSGLDDGFLEAAASIALLTVAAKNLGVFRSVGTIFGGVGKAIGIVSSPVLLAALAAIAAVGYLIWKNWDKVEPVLAAIGETAKIVGGAVWKELVVVFEEAKPIVMAILDSLVKKFGELVTWIADHTPAALGKMTEVAGKTWAAMKFGIQVVAIRTAQLFDVMGSLFTHTMNLAKRFGFHIMEIFGKYIPDPVLEAMGMGEFAGANFDKALERMNKETSKALEASSRDLDMATGARARIADKMVEEAEDRLISGAASAERLGRKVQTAATTARDRARERIARAQEGRDRAKTGEADRVQKVEISRVDRRAADDMGKGIAKQQPRGRRGARGTEPSSGMAESL